MSQYDETRVLSFNLHLLHFLQKPLGHKILDLLLTVGFLVCTIGGILRLCFLTTVDLMLNTFLRLGETVNILVLLYTRMSEFYWITAMYCLFWIFHINIIVSLSERIKNVYSLLKPVCITIHTCIVIWLINTQRISGTIFGIVVIACIFDVFWNILLINYLKHPRVSMFLLMHYNYNERLFILYRTVLPEGQTHECPQDCDKCPCSVCQNSIRNITVLQCGHHFCTDCIRTWELQCILKHSQVNCPLCRATVNIQIAARE